MAIHDFSLVDTCHATDIVPATHLACRDGHVLHSGILTNNAKESTNATACNGLLRLEHADDVTATVEGSLECGAVGGTDRTPRQLYKVVGIEVIGQTEIGLGTAVVHIVSYPVKVAVGPDDIDAVLATSKLFHTRLFIRMETVRAATDAIGVIVVTHAGFLEVCLMEALFTGIFHDGLLTVLAHNKAVITEVMMEFLDESAVITINDVIIFVNGKFLFAKILVISLRHIVTNQTHLGMTGIVGHIGCPTMVVIDNLSAIRTFLVVRLAAQRV